MSDPYTTPAPASGPRGAAADLRGLARNDQGFLAAGLLAFIFSFIAFAHFDVSGISLGNTDITAWHGIGILAGLLLLASVAVGAVMALAPGTFPELPFSPRVLAVGLAVLALLFLVIRWLTLPSTSFLGHHYGYSLAWGGYVTLILVVVQIVFGALGLRDSGEPMPWAGRATAG